jgi:RNA polymerase sigma-70 factor, ECF subfamily
MANEHSGLIEQRLNEKFDEGDIQGAAELIVKEYGGEVFGYLVGTLRSERDASEVFSQFCEDLCRGLPGFQRRCSFRSWVYKLATSARYRYRSDPYRKRGVRLETDAMRKLEEQVRSRTMTYLRTEVRDGFTRLRERLDTDEQSLLTLRIDRGLSWPEIALIMSNSDETPDEDKLLAMAAAVRQRFQRLKERIRRMARKEGLLRSE